MRMAGRFSQRVRGFAKAHGITVVDCLRGERKHELAEEYLATHPATRGLFMILVARAVAPVWDVQQAKNGVIVDLVSKKSYVNHYSFHILDPDWGHLTIKMSGHPPFGAQIILNGHEYVAAQATRAGIATRQEGNCFTHLADPTALASIADTLSEERMIGRLTQVCDRWIYSCCLCFALDVDEQERSGFRYAYAVYQLEYSRNLLFRVGGQMEQVFQAMIDRTRAHLGVRGLKTIFGAYCLTEECNPRGVVASRDILPRLPHNGRIRSAAAALCQHTDAVGPHRLTQGRRSRNGVQGARPLVRRSRTGGMGRPPVPITGPLSPRAPGGSTQAPRGRKGALDSRHAGFL